MLPRINASGGALVAISPQTVDNSALTQELGQFQFDLLSDSGNQVARQYGLAYKLSPAMAAELHAAVDLEVYNGDNSGELPLTATYVVDPQGVIRYAFVDPDFRKRAEPAEVVAALKMIAPAPPASAPTAARPARGVQLDYELTLRPPAERQVDVVARITGLDPGCPALALRMAESWAFARLPEPLLAGPVQAAADGYSLAIERSAPYAWNVQPAGHTEIELRYSVPLIHREQEAVRGSHAFEYPFVAPDHALLATAALVIFPAELDATATQVRLNVPPGWDICAPWRPLAPGVFDPGSVTALSNDYVAVGAWDRQEIQVGGFAGTLVFAPGQADVIGGSVDMIRRIIEQELALFGRPVEGRYLFVFGPPIERGMSGSPKTNSMVLAVDPKMADRGARHLAHLVAHEFFHTWGHSVGELPDELRWLNEGVTDYYAYLVSARLGFLSWEQFAAVLAEMMESATTSRRAGHTSLVEAGGPAFFTDPETRDLVYASGSLVGAWLDRAIRAEGRGRSLDDFMRALFNDPRLIAVKRGPDMADFVALLPQFVSADTARHIQETVCQPFCFDPVAVFTPLGVAVTPVSGPAHLDLRANLDGDRILDIDHKDLAYHIGLRENDRLLKINGWPVSQPADAHAAWREPQGERVRVTLMRGEQRLEIDEPLPTVLKYQVAAEPWRAHAEAGVTLVSPHYSRSY
jgi:predicted metalloprotease with PDZ domain/peroxiredoxin